ncbi:hypothetical protein AXJ14_gp182 [Geobacillus virus E3]|uniref:hypothetical protein n=1 Tax=Geobacillus virus E3 TaxID=1572712 RepID=UPI000671BE13|nr:hypothetical protein AXJ14_gp182 [Geobacillus virus E3]AJA41501.1 hypothetical protein E3_0182 [Geobacillus virus E3]
MKVEIITKHEELNDILSFFNSVSEALKQINADHAALLIEDKVALLINTVDYLLTENQRLKNKICRMTNKKRKE